MELLSVVDTSLVKLFEELKYLGMGSMSPHEGKSSFSRNVLCAVMDFKQIGTLPNFDVSCYFSAIRHKSSRQS